MTANGLQGHGQAALIAGRCQQVHMVRHEAIGVDSKIMRSGRLFEPTEKSQTIFVVDKNRLPVIAPQNNVLRLPCNE